VALIQQGAESIFLEMFLQLMEICGTHIQGTKHPLHHIPKMLYWVEIW